MTSRDLFLAKEDIFQWAIKGLVRNPAGQILLLRSVPRGLRLGGPTLPFWDIPGGRIQRYKTEEETLWRELQEETGITSFTNTGHFATFRVAARLGYTQTDVGLILSVYRLDVPDETEIVLSHEHDKFCWVGPVAAAGLLREKFPLEFTNKVEALGM